MQGILDRSRCRQTTLRATSVGRYYDPATAQFLSVDPLVNVTGARYTYAGDNPLDGTDPTGLDCTNTDSCPKGTTYTDNGGSWNDPNVQAPGSSTDQAISTLLAGGLNSGSVSACSTCLPERNSSAGSATSQSSSQGSSDSTRNSIADALEATSNALGTAGAIADLADAAEVTNPELLPAEIVSVPATETINGIATFTSCGADYFRPGPVLHATWNCSQDLFIWYSTVGFGSASTINAFGNAWGDAKQLAKDIVQYVP